MRYIATVIGELNDMSSPSTAISFEGSELAPSLAYGHPPDNIESESTHSENMVDIVISYVFVS